MNWLNGLNSFQTTSDEVLRSKKGWAVSSISFENKQPGNPRASLLLTSRKAVFCNLVNWIDFENWLLIGKRQKIRQI